MYFTHVLTPKSYLWNCLATFSNSSTATSTNNTLTIHALSYSGTIPNQNVTEDSSLNAFDLDTYFTNAQRYTFSGNTSINLSINSSNYITIIPNANYSGTQNITIIGWFNNASVSSNSFLVNVSAVNDAPYQITTIPNQETLENISFSLDMSQYFNDIDSILNFTINSTSFTTTKTSSLLTITPLITGSKQVTITASDSNLSVTSNTFTIEVTQTTNHEPSITAFSPESNPSLALGATQDFFITATDPDSDPLAYTWTLESSTVSSIESYTFTAETEGTYTLTATASDGQFQATKTWTIIVGTPIISEPNVESILKDKSSNSICGNGIPESDETCSSCALDVICPANTVCINNSCQQKESAMKAIIILTLVTIGIIIIAILIYYFTSLRTQKTQPKQFQYRSSTLNPPSDYTDFYKKK
jgi:hypothetical protein